MPEHGESFTLKRRKRREREIATMAERISLLPVAEKEDDRTSALYT